MFVLVEVDAGSDATTFLVDEPGDACVGDGYVAQVDESLVTERIPAAVVQAIKQCNNLK